MDIMALNANMLHIHRTTSAVIPDDAIFSWDGVRLVFRNDKIKQEVFDKFGYALYDHDIVFVKGQSSYGSFKLPPRELQVKSEVCVWPKDTEYYPVPTVYIWMPRS